MVNDEANTPPVCFHGGASFEAIGPRFDDLSRRHAVINADVLDAWFDPAPGVLDALREHLPWLVRTSPPTQAEGFLASVAAARGVPEECLVPGAGSSDLIFRALTRWLSPDSRALVLEPSYGEYNHVLRHVVGCRVDRLVLSREDDFDVPTGRLADSLHSVYDLVVLVNPNNPTGRQIPRCVLSPILADLPAATRVWIDETYIDYAGPGESLERIAATTPNVVVCKSMSKAYALSGLRVGYLCCIPETAQELRDITPPWVVGLPAQVAAVLALRDPAYYAQRYRQTHQLREALAGALERTLGARTITGVINSVLCLLPEPGPKASDLVDACRARGIFLRDCQTTCPSLGPRALRVSVKMPSDNARIIEALEEFRGS